jgi:hypothetical protein
LHGLAGADDCCYVAGRSIYYLVNHWQAAAPRHFKVQHLLLQATAVTILSSPWHSACVYSARAANVQRQRGERTAASANIDQLIQAYTAEYTGRDKQIQSYTSRYEFHIKSYVTVCHAEIQADTDNRTAISDHMGMYAVPYLLPHTSRYNQIQAKIRNP